MAQLEDVLINLQGTSSAVSLPAGKFPNNVAGSTLANTILSGFVSYDTGSAVDVTFEIDLAGTGYGNFARAGDTTQPIQQMRQSGVYTNTGVNGPLTITINVPAEWTKLDVVLPWASPFNTQRYTIEINGHTVTQVRVGFGDTIDNGKYATFKGIIPDSNNQIIINVVNELNNAFMFYNGFWLRNIVDDSQVPTGTTYDFEDTAGTALTDIIDGMVSTGNIADFQTDGAGNLVNSNDWTTLGAVNNTFDKVAFSIPTGYDAVSGSLWALLRSAGDVNTGYAFDLRRSATNTYDQIAYLRNNDFQSPYMVFDSPIDTTNGPVTILAGITGRTITVDVYQNNRLVQTFVRTDDAPILTGGAGFQIYPGATPSSVQLTDLTFYDKPDTSLPLALVDAFPTVEEAVNDAWQTNTSGANINLPTTNVQLGDILIMIVQVDYTAADGGEIFHDGTWVDIINTSDVSNSVGLLVCYKIINALNKVEATTVVSLSAIANTRAGLSRTYRIRGADDINAIAPAIGINLTADGNATFHPNTSVTMDGVNKYLVLDFLSHDTYTTNILSYPASLTDTGETASGATGGECELFWGQKNVEADSIVGGENWVVSNDRYSIPWTIVIAPSIRGDGTGTHLDLPKQFNPEFRYRHLPAAPVKHDINNVFGKRALFSFFPGNYNPVTHVISGSGRELGSFHSIGQVFNGHARVSANSGELRVRPYTGGGGYSGMVIDTKGETATGGRIEFEGGATSQIHFPHKDSFTIWGLVRPDGNGNDGNGDPRILSRDEGGGSQDHIYMIGGVRFGGATRARSRVRLNGATETLIVTSQDWQNDALNFVAVTFDGTFLVTHHIREDGGYGNISSIAHSLGTVLTDSVAGSMGLSIGGNFGSNNCFRGELLGTGIIDGPMDETQLRALMDDITQLLAPATANSILIPTSAPGEAVVIIGPITGTFGATLEGFFSAMQTLQKMTQPFSANLGDIGETGDGTLAEPVEGVTLILLPELFNIKYPAYPGAKTGAIIDVKKAEATTILARPTDFQVPSGGYSTALFTDPKRTGKFIVEIQLLAPSSSNGTGVGLAKADHSVSDYMGHSSESIINWWPSWGVYRSPGGQVSSVPNLSAFNSMVLAIDLSGVFPILHWVRGTESSISFSYEYDGISTLDDDVYLAVSGSTGDHTLTNTGDGTWINPHISNLFPDYTLGWPAKVFETPMYLPIGGGVKTWTNDYFDGTGSLGDHWEQFYRSTTAPYNNMDYVTRNAGYLSGDVTTNVGDGATNGVTLWYQEYRGRMDYQEIHVPETGSTIVVYYYNCGIGPIGDRGSDFSPDGNPIIFCGPIVHKPDLSTPGYEFAVIGHRDVSQQATIETKTTTPDNVSQVNHHGDDTLGFGVTHADFKVEIDDTGVVLFSFAEVGSGNWQLINGTGRTGGGLGRPWGVLTSDDTLLLGIVGYQYGSAGGAFNFSCDAITTIEATNGIVVNPAFQLGGTTFSATTVLKVIQNMNNPFDDVVATIDSNGLTLTQNLDSPLNNVVSTIDNNRQVLTQSMTNTLIDMDFSAPTKQTLSGTISNNLDDIDLGYTISIKLIGTLSGSLSDAVHAVSAAQEMEQNGNITLEQVASTNTGIMTITGSTSFVLDQLKMFNSVDNMVQGVFAATLGELVLSNASAQKMTQNFSPTLEGGESGSSSKQVQQTTLDKTLLDTLAVNTAELVLQSAMAFGLNESLLSNTSKVTLTGSLSQVLGDITSVFVEDDGTSRIQGTLAIMLAELTSVFDTHQFARATLTAQLDNGTVNNSSGQKLTGTIAATLEDYTETVNSLQKLVGGISTNLLDISLSAQLEGVVGSLPVTDLMYFNEVTTGWLASSLMKLYDQVVDGSPYGAKLMDKMILSNGMVGRFVWQVKFSDGTTIIENNFSDFTFSFAEAVSQGRRLPGATYEERGYYLTNSLPLAFNAMWRVPFKLE